MFVSLHFLVEWNTKLTDSISDIALVVQQAFENLEEDDKSDLVEEILEGFDRVVRDNWGSKWISYYGFLFG
jgi:hypothetical protein